MKVARIVAVWLALGAPAGAQVWDISYAGVTLGQVNLDSGKALRVDIRAPGLAGALRGVTYQAQVAQGLAEVRLVSGRRQFAAVLDVAGAAPVVMAYRATPAETVPPAVPGAGAVDPATALHAALIRPPGSPCPGAEVFDGQRLLRLDLTGQGDACAGQVIRLGGYAAAEMEARGSFALRLIYGPDGVLQRAEVQTPAGKLRLKRR